MPSTVIGCLYVNFLLPEMEWPHFECKYYSLWYGRRIAKSLYIELKGGKCFCWISRWEVRWRHGFGGRTEAFQRRLKSHRWWDRIPWSYGSHDEWVFVHITYDTDLPKVVDNGSTSSIGNEYQKMLYRNIYKLLIVL